MFNTITPEKAGISSKLILKFLKSLNDNNLKTHSFIMARGNNIFAEGYYAPFNKNSLHRMYSISKTFVSVAIGLLEEEGLLKLDDKMIDFFPEYSKDALPKEMCEMTIYDMLTMQTCIASHKKWFYQEIENRVDAYFMANAEKIPGTNFKYDSPASFMLCCIVEKLTGKPFLDYLKEKFLNEIGFSKESYCLKCLGGYSFGDSGINCTARDLLIFARFVMNYGVINGKRYMNSKYLEDATSMQTSTDYGGEFASDSFGYGYQIWMAPNNCFAFVGMGDQIALCDRKNDFVFIINSDNQGLNSFGKTIIYHELYNTIINNLSEPLDDDEESFNTLNDYISNLKLYSIKGQEYNSIVNMVNNKVYKLENNPMNIEWIRLEFADNKGTLSYKNKQGNKTLNFGLCYNEFQKFPEHGYSALVAGEVFEGNMYDCAASAAWVDNKKLRIYVQIIDNYLGNLIIDLAFKNNTVGISMRKNAESFLDEYEGYANGYVL